MMVMEHTLSSTRLEQLKARINDKDYVSAAIQRIALVLSNELMSMSQGGDDSHERQWERKRKR
jgi:hypothetical protein